MSSLISNKAMSSNGVGIFLIIEVIEFECVKVFSVGVVDVAFALVLGGKS